MQLSLRASHKTIQGGMHDEDKFSHA
jgi:hypothetical protein